MGSTILFVGAKGAIDQITRSLPFMVGGQFHIKTAEELSPELAEGMTAIVMVNALNPYSHNGSLLPPIYYACSKDPAQSLAVLCTQLNSL